MEATADQIRILDQLQVVDRSRLQAERALGQLPQRGQVVGLRKRKKEIEGKLEKVRAMHSREERQLERIELEDSQLADKQAKTQEKIDNASGDYRSINVWTRDLEGMSKRRATLGDDLTAAMQKISEIEGVEKQAKAAIERIDAEEARLVAQYREQSDKLSQDIQKCQEAGRALAAQLPRELVERYIAASKRCGGIGLAHLQDSRCSACRSTIEHNRLLQLKADAPIAECPSCHRMLVMD